MSGRPGDAGPALDSSAAMLRAESGHLDATVSALALRLSQVPGLQMKISRGHGRLRSLLGDLPYVNDLHRSSDPIEEILVTVAEHSYRLRCRAGSLTCEIGPAPMTAGAWRLLAFGEWAEQLQQAIAGQNFANHDSMVALRRLIEQDRVE